MTLWSTHYSLRGFQKKAKVSLTLHCVPPLHKIHILKETIGFVGLHVLLVHKGSEMTHFVSFWDQPDHLQAVLGQCGSLPAGRTRICFHLHSETTEIIHHMSISISVSVWREELWFYNVDDVKPRPLSVTNSMLSFTFSHMVYAWIKRKKWWLQRFWMTEWLTAEVKHPSLPQSRTQWKRKQRNKSGHIAASAFML